MELLVQPRTHFGKKAKLLRKQNQIPAVVYGKHLAQPLHISIEKISLVRAYQKAGYSTALQLKGEGINELVLFHDMHADPITDHAMHVDFLAVKSDEKVRAEVPVVLVGESPVEKLNLGSIQQILMQVEVEAFPMDLPNSIEFDIAAIDQVGIVINVSGLKVRTKDTTIEDMEAAVLTAVEFEEEKEEKPVAAVVAAPGAEGAAPAGDKESK